MVLVGRVFLGMVNSWTRGHPLSRHTRPENREFAGIARVLLNNGEKDVVVFDINPSTKLLEDVKDRIEVIRGDLGNFSHVLNLVKNANPRAIYHLGGMLSVPSDADPAASFRANAMGTFHVLEAAKLFQVPQVLFSSTLATYGLDVRADMVGDYTLQRPQLFCAKGNPFTITVSPETRCPVMYYKDAALAMVKLAQAPLENIQMVNYVIAGATPIATAQELVDIVKERIPTARIDFQPDMAMQPILDKLLLPMDDRLARKEWGWEPSYDQERIVDDFLEELKAHPKRYE
ncbi:MAG: GDP-mannose 4,6-dehydratase [Deltaproteobacteria bacterium]